MVVARGDDPRRKSVRPPVPSGFDDKEEGVMETRFGAERLIGAPAEVVCLLAAFASNANQ
jgi:hypothetical protein